MGRIYNDILELIGRTPLVRIRRALPAGGAAIYTKLESFNPGGSIKDRICLAMIAAAEREGKLSPGATVVEPTSGNTGIGLAMVCAVRGYKLILTMPESMSLERRALLRAYGAEIVLTKAERGMTGAVEKANEIVQHTPGSFMPQQFENPANPQVHRETTAQEIIEDLGGIVPDVFVTGIGTGGHITGAGEVMRAKFPNLKIVAVEPVNSAVLSGGKPGPHKIQGIGAGFVPRVLNTKIYDRVITVADADAWAAKVRLAKEEGILVGISSGAAHHAAMTLSGELGVGKTVVTVAYDTGERYFSMNQHFEGANPTAP